jgi:hypothetical protein
VTPSLAEGGRIDTTLTMEVLCRGWEAKFDGDRESSVSMATMATFDVRSRSLPAEFRSTTRSERSPPNLSERCSESTSWGSLVRAQYRPPKKPLQMAGLFVLGVRGRQSWLDGDRHLRESLLVHGRWCRVTQNSGWGSAN